MRLHAKIIDGNVRYTEIRDNFGFLYKSYEFDFGGFYDSVIETIYDRKNSSTYRYTYRTYNKKKTLITSELHTRNGSVEESYSVNGNISYRTRRNVDGLLHSVGEPAYQEWYDNGLRKLEIYYTRNKFNNPVGPAVSKWKESGYLLRHKYYSHGNKIHRDILTARMERDYLGEI